MATPCCWPTLGWRLLPAGDPQPCFASGLSPFAPLRSVSDGRVREYPTDPSDPHRLIFTFAHVLLYQPALVRGCCWTTWPARRQSPPLGTDPDALWPDDGQSTVPYAIAYDRYAAICHPLQYLSWWAFKFIDSWRLADGLWTHWTVSSSLSSPWPSLSAGPERSTASSAGYCCPGAPLLRHYHLWGSHMSVCILTLLVPVTVILAPSHFIILTIHRMTSSEAQEKAYIPPTWPWSAASMALLSTIVLPDPRKDPISLLHTIIIPVLNPSIYSLGTRMPQGLSRKHRETPRWNLRKSVFLQGPCSRHVSPQQVTSCLTELSLWGLQPNFPLSSNQLLMFKMKLTFPSLTASTSILSPWPNGFFFRLQLRNMKITPCWWCPEKTFTVKSV